jgi:hypothetical protein
VRFVPIGVLERKNEHNQKATIDTFAVPHYFMIEHLKRMKLTVVEVLGCPSGHSISGPNHAAQISGIPIGASIKLLSPAR